MLHLHFTLPAPVRQVLSLLDAGGFAAYVVGGCVRDMLMGVPPHDYDVATDALPVEIAACFRGFRVIETGAKHGTVTVVIGGETVEVTTFRVDGAYSDNRRPDTVAFTGSLDADLARRDFTVNAMAYSPHAGLVDPFGGQGHIAERKIVCVGEPDERFCEDGLRILRAMRFASVLDFSVEGQTAASIHRNKSLLRNISAERVFAELCRLLCGENVCAVLLEFADALCEVIPELAPMVGFPQENRYHCYDVFTHTAKAVEAAPPDKILRLAAFFHDFGKPEACVYTQTGQHFYGHAKLSAALCGEILRRLRADNRTLREVTQLVELHDAQLAATEKSVRRFAAKTSVAFTRQLLCLQRADTLAHAPGCLDRLKLYDEVEAVLDRLEEQGACLCVRDLAVNGHDLMAIGIPQGEAVGQTLCALCRMVVDGEIDNEREALLRQTMKLAQG